MLYTFVLLDKPGASALRDQVRPEHKTYLGAVADRIAFAGPLLADDGQAMVGSLLVIDFAPHDLEFLREEYAHDRLGFTPAQVAGWMRDAGLEPRLQRDMAPTAAAGPQALTVSLWLGERPAAGEQIKPARTRALQEAR